MPGCHSELMYHIFGYEFNTGVITVMFNIPDADDDRGSQIHYAVRLLNNTSNCTFVLKYINILKAICLKHPRL